MSSYNLAVNEQRKKYDMIQINGMNLYRIKALRDIPEIGVTKGDLGGLIEKEENLSQEGNCWVFLDAIVRGNAKVYDDALIKGHSEVKNFAKVYGHAEIRDLAGVFEYAEIFDNAIIDGCAKIYGKAKVFGNAKVLDNVDVYDNVRISDDSIVRGWFEASGNLILYGQEDIFFA